ncbi:PEGA domain-containing protein [Nannocystaceae bacterium ST9]
MSTSAPRVVGSRAIGLLVLVLVPGLAHAGAPESEPAPLAQGQGRLVLEGSAVGVEVVIRDERGRERSLGRLPLTIDLPAGSFELIVDEPGYVPWRTPVEIVAGVATEVAVEPALIDEALVIAEDVSDTAKGAELRVDGEALCTLPCRTTLPPGDHRVEIHQRKMKPLAFDLEVKQADRIELEVVLERATSRAPAIITGSVALGCLGTAIFFTVRADKTRRSLADDLATHGQYDASDSRIDVGRRDAVIATAMYGVTAIATGLTMYYLLRQAGNPSRVEKRRQTLAWTIAPGFGPTGAGLFGALRF